MRKKSNDEYKVFHSANFSDIKPNIKLPYPFNEELINLLKEENKLEQEYYYITKGNDYAFFIIYKNKMNIFTFGKLEYYLNLKVIGFPCSLSNVGYVTNNEQMMFEYIKSIKGAKLVLNAEQLMTVKNFTTGQTLPTCILELNFENEEEYLKSLRSSYRRRIMQAVKNTEDVEVKEILDDSIDIYDLYLNTYNKSNYKLEKLEKGFFDKVEATKLVFLKDDNPIGFTLLKKDNEKLIFMLCGMDYSSDTTDLYYYMLLSIIKYAFKNNCKYIDFGQTSEETKMKFGATLQKKYFYVHHSNKVLNCVAKAIRESLEYKYDFPKYRVFKELKK